MWSNSILGRRGPVGLKRRSETHEANASVHAEKMGAFDSGLSPEIHTKVLANIAPKSGRLHFFGALNPASMFTQSIGFDEGIMGPL